MWSGPIKDLAALVGPDSPGAQPYHVLDVPPLSPPGDDGANLTRQMALAAALGYHLGLNGTYTLATPWLWSSGVTIDATAGTVLHSTVSGAGLLSPIQTPFGAYGATTTLAAPAHVGDLSVRVADATAFAAEQTIAQGVGNHIQALTVARVAGTILYLAEPVALAQPLGTPIAPFAITHDVTFNANGALLTGTGWKGLEISFGTRITVTGLRISGTFSTIAVSLDVGGCDNELRDCDVNGNAFGGSVCVSVEGNNRSRLTRVKAYNSGAAQALWLDNVTNFVALDCYAWAAGTHGIQWTSSPQSNSVVLGGWFGSNTSLGLFMSGSSGITFVGTTFADNPGYGVELASDTDNIVFCGVSCIDNTNGGIFTLSSGSVRISDYYSAWSLASAGVVQFCGLRVAGTGTHHVVNWTDANSYDNALCVTAAAVVHVTGFNWSPGPGQTGWIGALLDIGATGARLVLRDGEINLSVVDVTAVATASVATVHLHDVVTSPGAAAGTVGGRSVGVASTWLWGAGTDFGSAAHPYDLIDGTAVQTKVLTAAGHP